MSAAIYSTIEEKNFDEGIAFIMTHKNSIIEAHIYSGIIINFKCLRLSLDQICNALSSGEINEITFQRTEVRPETAQARVIAHTFPGAVAASAIAPARTPLSKLLKISRLLSSLTKSDKDEGRKAFDLICRQIILHYPGFLPDASTIKKRIGRVADEFGISTKFLDNMPVPTDIYLIPEWVFSNFEAMGNGLMKDVALYYILFGEYLKKFVRTTAAMETSFGAKQGFAILSKAIYPQLQDNSIAIIFKGAEKVGEMKIDWHTDKKNTMLFTKVDLDKLGLDSGSKINLILKD